MFDLLSDEYAHEWALGLASQSAADVHIKPGAWTLTAKTPLFVGKGEEITHVITDGIVQSLMPTADDVTAKLDAAAERWMFLRHLFASKSLVQRLDVLIECAIQAEEANRLRSQLRARGMTAAAVEAVAAGGAS